MNVTPIAPLAGISPLVVAHGAAFPPPRSATSEIKQIVVCSSPFRVRDGADGVTDFGQHYTPGYIPAHYLVPHRPDVAGGLFIAYRVWSDSRLVIRATPADAESIFVVALADLTSRHGGGFIPRVDDTGMLALAALIDSLMAAHPRAKLVGEHALGDRFSPGDFLESWVYERNGAAVSFEAPAAMPTHYRGNLRNARDLQNALARLGFASEDKSGWWGASSLRALEGFQSSQGLEVSGHLDPVCEARIRAVLTSDPSRS